VPANRLADVIQPMDQSLDHGKDHGKKEDDSSRVLTGVSLVFEEDTTANGTGISDTNAAQVDATQADVVQVEGKHGGQQCTEEAPRPRLCPLQVHLHQLQYAVKLESSNTSGTSGALDGKDKEEEVVKKKVEEQEQEQEQELAGGHRFAIQCWLDLQGGGDYSSSHRGGGEARVIGHSGGDG
jgi:hypothetical protein